MVLFFFFTFVVLGEENSFNSREDRAYIENSHSKFDDNISVEIQNNEVNNDTRQILSEKEILWEKIKKDSNSTQKITVIHN